MPFRENSASRRSDHKVKPLPATINADGKLRLIADGHRGGRFGFPSAHSGNAWAVAFFVAYLFRKRVLTWFLCAWALLVCYSRLYLAVHYPGDLLGGLVLAVVGATLVYWVFAKVSREEPKPELRHVYIPIIVGMLTIMILFVVSLCR